MPIQYDIDSVNRIVYVSIPATIDIGDIEGLVIELRKDLRFKKSIAALIDARELRRAFFVRESPNLHKLITRRSAKFVSRYALVVNQDFAPQASRRFLVRARRHGVNMKTFKDHTAALAWLKC